jgi:glyoxylase-like metal-dependent hydrolase (beta-lactamase superfamily II)
MTETIELQHITLHPLADGVWASIANGMVATSNAAIVDTGTQVIVFDPHLTPTAGAELAAAAQSLTGKPIDILVNSHYHGDHVFGNISFPRQTILISTERTRQLIIDNNADIEQNKGAMQEQWRTLLAEARAELTNATDASQRTEIEGQIFDLQVRLADVPRFQLRVPEQTFTERMVFFGSQRRAELITFGGAHTESDALLWLPEDGVAIIADILFNQRQPWAGHGNPDGWLKRLDEIEGLSPQQVVPGHGPLATVEDFGQMRSYMQVLKETLAGLSSAEEIDALELPALLAEAYGADDKQPFINNVRTLYERGFRG